MLSSLLAFADASPVEVTPGVFAAVAIAALFVGVAKGGFSGISPLLTLIVALAVPTTVAIGVLLPLLMIGDVIALWAHWGHWNLQIVLRLVPGAALGVLVASFTLQSLSETGLRLGIAAVTILFVGYRLAEMRRQRRRANENDDRQEARPVRPLAPIWGWAAGSAAGVTSTIAHVGGPPVAVYLLTERVPPRTYVATTAMFFFVVNWLKVPGYIAADLVGWSVLATLAPTALLIGPGVLIGRAFVQRVPRHVFDNVVLASLVAGAVLLLV